MLQSEKSTTLQKAKYFPIPLFYLCIRNVDFVSAPSFSEAPSYINLKDSN